MFRKFICCITAICIVMLSCVPALAAASESKESAPHSDIQRIFDDYHARCAEIEFESNSGSRASTDTEMLYSIAKSDTIAQIESAGYVGYDVTPNTYSDIETALHTDLGELGLDPNLSYIIAVGGEPSLESASAGGMSRYGNAEPSFTYTYNGYTHTMRYVIVTASHVPGYYKTDSVDLLDSNNPSTINNFFNTAFYYLLDQISEHIPFGTIAAFCGISFANINTSQNATCTLTASASWIRMYTQIYTESTGIWLSWCSSDNVTVRSRMQGCYFDVNDEVERVFDTGDVKRTIYSEHDNNTLWRKNQAAAAWQSGNPVHEYVGHVEIYHGNELIFRFLQTIVTPP